MESVKIYLKTPEDAENFVQTMRQFEGEYDLTLGSVTVDAKSILGVFALGIGKENAISRQTLSQITGVGDRQIREAIEALRHDNAILALESGKGYYIPPRTPQGR